MPHNRFEWIDRLKFVEREHRVVATSFVMDEDYLLTAARYVELNRVRAGLVQAPSRCRWSSAAAHLRRRDDVLV